MKPLYSVFRSTTNGVKDATRQFCRYHHRRVFRVPRSVHRSLFILRWDSRFLRARRWRLPLRILRWKQGSGCRQSSRDGISWMNNYTISFDFRESLGSHEGEFIDGTARYDQLEPILKNMQARCRASKDTPRVKIRWGIFNKTLISGDISKCLAAVSDHKDWVVCLLW